MGEIDMQLMNKAKEYARPITAIAATDLRWSLLADTDFMQNTNPAEEEEDVELGSNIMAPALWEEDDL